MGVALAQVLAEGALALALVPVLALRLLRLVLVTLVEPHVLLALELPLVMAAVIELVALVVAEVALRMLGVAAVGAVGGSVDVWLGGVGGGGGVCGWVVVVAAKYWWKSVKILKSDIDKYPQSIDPIYHVPPMTRWKSAILQRPVFTYTMGLVLHHHALDFDHTSIQMRCSSLEIPPAMKGNGGWVCIAMRSPWIERRPVVCI